MMNNFNLENDSKAQSRCNIDTSASKETNNTNFATVTGSADTNTDKATVEAKIDGAKTEVADSNYNQAGDVYKDKSYKDEGISSNSSKLHENDGQANNQGTNQGDSSNTSTDAHSGANQDDEGKYQGSNFGKHSGRHAEKQATDDNKQKVEALQQEVSKLTQAILALKQEHEASVKRNAKELEEAKKFAVNKFAQEMVTTYDNLDLALKSINAQDKQDVKFANIVFGLEMVMNALLASFKQFSITIITVNVGDKFDPEEQECLAQEVNNEVAANHVLKVAKHGFKLNDRLLRPAAVILAAAE